MGRGERVKEPWVFPVTNVKKMLEEARTIVDAVNDENVGGIFEYELEVAINNLRHCADELERSQLEMRYNIRRTH